MPVSTLSKGCLPMANWNRVAFWWIYKMQRLADTVTYWVALVMSVYHIVASQYSIFGSEQHINLHILFALVIVFLQAMKFATKKDRVISGLLTRATQ